jgi:hypothetical protein
MEEKLDNVCERIRQTLAMRRKCPRCHGTGTIALADGTFTYCTCRYGRNLRTRFGKRTQ